MQRFLAALVCAMAIWPVAAVASPWSSLVTTYGPMAWYRLDETSGTTVNDSSGHGYNGTINLPADVTQNVTGLLVADSDSALQFTTSASYNEVILPVLPYWSNLTVIVIVSGTYSGNQSFVNYKNNVLGAKGGHPAVLFPGVAPYPDSCSDAAVTLTAGQPYFLAFENNSSSGGSFVSVNGSSLYRFGAGCQFSNYNNTQSINGGNQGPGNPMPTFLGTEDEVVIFNSALSQASITNLAIAAGYASGNSGFFGVW